jgi:glycosyltransferase involved in cell wall biosynthesis
MTVRVGIYAPINPGGYDGGVEQYVIGLAYGFEQLHTDSISATEIEYVFITSPLNPDWIDSHLGENMSRVTRPWEGTIERIRGVLGPLERHLKPYAESLLSKFNSKISYDISNDKGLFSDLELDVVHFVVQEYIRTDKPTLFNPHDLQHLYYPEFFSDYQLSRKREVYSTGCKEADIVDTPSRATKKDVVEHYEVNPDKVQPVPLGPPVGIYDDVTKSEFAEVKAAYDLPTSFILFPSKTWPHKNHLRLVKAIKYVEETFDEEIHLVCTGRQTDHWKKVEIEIKELSLEDRISFLGYVDVNHLRALYELSRCVVLPSLFEGGGFPLLEAWEFETPVVCSNVTSLPEKGGDAATYFDPMSVSAMGEEIYKVWSNGSLRDKLIRNAKQRRKRFSWKRTAEIYQKLYYSLCDSSYHKDKRCTLL